MFTLADVRNIAVQIEQNGEEAYRRAATRTNNPEMARLFTWMADEERRHGELFATFMDTDTPPTAEQAELEAMGRALLKDIVRSQTFSLEAEQLDQATDLEDLLTQSIAFESDTISFYEFLTGFLDSPEAVTQLNGIIEQERGHVQQLEQMRVIAQYVPGPPPVPDQGTGPQV